jgi:nucleoside-diphosphate-sugar epimerase
MSTFLVDEVRPVGRVLVTGASGYVGALAAAALLQAGSERVVLPLRGVGESERVRRFLRWELEAEGVRWNDGLDARIVFCQLPVADDLEALAAMLQRHSIEDVIHCAGSVSYYDEPALESANVELTRALLRACGAAQRFVFISTAFACGYAAGLAPESLLEDPPADPTPYTASKRRAERLVASSGLPYLVIRPAVLIGDSRDGRYAGKQYGLYQLWMGAERYLTKRYFTTCHAVAPTARVSFVHQDAFKNALVACLLRLSNDRFVHVVSQTQETPSMRTAQQLWFERVIRPHEVYYHADVDAVPMASLDPRQRALFALASVNLKIATREWAFDDTTLKALQHAGLAFAHTTERSLVVCQERFMRASERLQEYHRQFAHLMPGQPRSVFLDAVPRTHVNA